MDALLFAAGIALILIGALLIALALTSIRGEVKGGGVIMIGPFPIIFGDRSLAPLLLILALAVMLVLVMASLLTGSGGGAP
ncbi:MAG: DUF131 domain-containing protein [Thaumarchaeota archaeon]|nr:DUF131 domain-containing protein [Nitrososphaerota archaeon]